MRKLALACCAILMLSGCALTSTYTIDSSGNVSGTTSFGVPKSSVRNVKTIEQWAQVLQDNNFPSPTTSPSASPSGLPAPAISCGPGEDLVNSQWTYTCSVSGDVSVLSEATDVTGLAGSSEDSGTSSSTGLKISRIGNTLTVTQPAGNTTGDSSGGIGLKGISLFSTNSTITFPGEVTSVTGGAEKVDDDTVSFTSDESQSSEMGATVVLRNVNSTATSVDLTVNPSPLAAGSADVELTASLASPARGQVTFFDGDVSLGTTDVDAAGTAKFMAGTQPDGAHNYKAVFKPNDWMKVDQSQDEASLSFKTLKMSKYPNISGIGKVGATLGLANLKSRPAATQVSYKWLRNGKVIAGQSGKTYKVVAADFRKRIAVRVTLKKPEYLAITFDTQAIQVSKR